MRILTHLQAISRLASSENGNPRFMLHTSHGDFRTKPDAAVSYEVENFINPISHTVNGLLVTLHVDGRGNVWDVVAE